MKTLSTKQAAKKLGLSIGMTLELVRRQPHLARPRTSAKSEWRFIAEEVKNHTFAVGKRQTEYKPPAGWLTAKEFREVHNPPLTSGQLTGATHRRRLQYVKAGGFIYYEPTQRWSPQKTEEIPTVAERLQRAVDRLVPAGWLNRADLKKMGYTDGQISGKTTDNNKDPQKGWPHRLIRGQNYYPPDFATSLLSIDTLFADIDVGETHTLDYVASRVHTANKKWWIDINTGEPIKRNVGELLMLATSELAEALEGDRKSLQDDKLPQYKMFDVEIVDCFIRLFDIAGGMGIPLGEIFEEKMAFNAVRKDHQIEHRRGAEGKKY